MSKPILCLFQKLHQAQIEDLQLIASNYDVIQYYSANEASVALNNIEITLGWSKKTGDRLLASPKSQLRWIQAVSAGVDSFDLSLLKSKKILLSNSSGIHSVPITESIFGMLLCHYRGLQTALIGQQSAHWMTNIPYGELSGKKMLVVGAGQIGQHLAKVASVFDIEVIGVNRTGHSAQNFAKTIAISEIDHWLPNMDIVVNLLPGTTTTKHFFDEKLFARMKTGVCFLNVGRGTSVQTDGLVKALKNNKIGFAGLDVFEEEPLPSDHPLWSMNHVMITPHIAGQTAHFKERIYSIFRENLDGYLKTGQLIRNQVDLNNGY